MLYYTITVIFSAERPTSLSRTRARRGDRNCRHLFILIINNNSNTVVITVIVIGIVTIAIVIVIVIIIMIVEPIIVPRDRRGCGQTTAGPGGRSGV